jgi:curved DNA-binding protein CbpA
VADRHQKVGTVIATSGKLADAPLPNLLHSLFASKATGVLKLETRTGQHAVFLREGYPVSVTLPGSVEMLGKVLLEMGILDDARYKQSLAQPPPKGKRYGELLVEQGLVTPDQIRLGLKAQVRRKLHRLFFLNDGSWSIQAGEHNQGMQGTESLRVHPYRAIYHGVRSAWAAEQLVGALFLLEGKAVRAKIGPEDAARYGLGADDGRVAELLRKGYWTIPDLIEGAGVPAQAVHALLYSFYITEALDIQSADAVPRLKRKAGEPLPPSAAPAPSEAVRARTQTGSFTAPQPQTGSFTAPQPQTGGGFTAPQPGTPKSIQRPGAPPPVPGHTPPAGTKLPSGSGYPQTGRTPSGNYPQAGRAPSGTGYPQLPGGGGIDFEAVRRQLEVKAKVIEAENLFEVLELPITAGREEVKTAYFEAARRYHPDRLQSLGLDNLRSDVEKIFRRVSEAYATLYDDTQREAYLQAMNKPRSGGDAEAHAKAMKMLEAEMAFRRGEIALRKNDYAGALPELEAAAKANPAEGEHLAYLTWCKLCLGQLNHTAARPIFQEAVKLSPKCARAFYFLGQCLKEEREIDKAYNAFRKATDLDPRLLDAEREMRLINMRKEKSSKSGLLSKLLSRK